MTNPYATTGFTYKHIAAGQATTVVKSKPGVLYAIAYNTAATTNNTTSIYDDAATAGATLALAGTPAAGTIYYNCEFQNGLTIITAAANGSDMTVIYV